MTTKLVARAEQELPEVLADLRRLVEHETPSNDKRALDAGLADIEQWLTERLGTPVARQRHDGGPRGDVLDVTYPGTTGGTVLLLCHYDTVWPVGTLAEWPFTVDGDRITAPGALDMKLGIVHGVWALRLLRELDIPHPSVRFLLNGDEEIGSISSRPHIEQACTEATATLVLEPSREGMAKIRRKGLGLFDLAVHGVESHAGLDPTAGASAIHAIAELIPAITSLAAPERGTTINVGLLNGGTGRNVVAGRATCEIDIRIQDPAEMPRIDAGFRELAVADERIRVELTGGWNRPPMNPNPLSEKLFEHAKAAAEEHGRALEGTSVGGVSDANFVSALDKPVLDGLGAVGAGPHSRDEHVIPSESPGQIATLATLISNLRDF
ncbi:glutamate carboxypeptidase [Saccharopolyspora kobensis]|uniref:Glutamate carboxypeptidase n=1 Tax=Saccharopolyspora kobensis TaxID=146035 RepID=A0A1H5TB01_9PSEU|nr:M20 family metallopeptidase [Saccharopolyspora kobensis]SEF59976.1 glutamate carboxypeptidase [Saccharopolyspora kobensis]SFC48129.1 glutamate carboxypeptidase [Saccharopolyspora kobensis]